MRKSPQHKDVRTMKEIIEEESRSSLLLYTDQPVQPSWLDPREQRRLMRSYLRIARRSGSSWGEQEIENAEKWYSQNGFPGRLVSVDFSSGSIANPIELFLPMVEAAQTLRGLFDLYEAWTKAKDGSDKELARLVTIKERKPNEPDGVAALNDRDQEVVDNHAKMRVIALLKKQEKEKRMPYLRNLGSDSSAVLTSARAQCLPQIYFRDTTLAWFCDPSFMWEEIEPIASPRLNHLELTNSELLWLTEGYLIRAVNIMLRGINPALVQTEKGTPPRPQYQIRCPWHAIAMAFAQLISNSHLEIRWCDICGKDISEMDKRAKVCRKESCRTEKKKKKQEKPC